MISTAVRKHPLAVSSWDAAECMAAFEVIASGQTTMGPKVAAFERAFAEKLGCAHAVMVNSGSSANLLMVAAYTLKHGPGTVIVPAIAWATTYAPFQQYGWNLLVVDVDDTLNADPEQVRLAATQYPDCQVAVACHVLGNPCDLARWPVHLQILEDNCEALGARYHGRWTGTLGDMGTHSFFFSHHLCTMEGGMITTNHREYADMLRSLRSHGWTRHLAPDNALGVTPEAFSFIYPGYNVRPLEIEGAIGLVQLEKLDRLIAQRRANAAACPLPLPREVGESSWFGFATPRTTELDERCETRPVIAGCFTRSAAAGHYAYRVIGDLPVARRIHDEWCYIGNHGSPIDWATVLHG